MVALENTSPTGWYGSLNLVYAHRQGATQLIHTQVKAPLKVQRPFYPEGSEVCHSVVLHTAGGVVGGDRNSLDFHLEPNAQALITTAAAAKIYRSNGLEARQTIQMQVEAGACLEWLPQETIVFNGAIYRQDLRVELAPGALWLGWEITRFGRSARGEQFLQGEWRSHTEIWQKGRPLWIDRQWLPAGEEILNSPHGLAGQPVVASLAWVGGAVSPEIVDKARSLWAATERQGEAGVTQLTQGLLCRYRGFSSSEVRNWFTEVWHLLRLSYLGRSSCRPRVWQI
ncbi:MAG: urease accessory protein UreD [Aphanothece sp. CMT-3BRIN-NPC111]|jgi:urease accessory protein|nr:urease accessory protein UreD [Aphanothece sp. CMT-3BRIN-NPC111]